MLKTRQEVAKEIDNDVTRGLIELENQTDKFTDEPELRMSHSLYQLVQEDQLLAASMREADPLVRQFINELFKHVERDFSKSNFADSLEEMIKDKMRDLNTEE